MPPCADSNKELSNWLRLIMNVWLCLWLCCRSTTEPNFKIGSLTRWPKTASTQVLGRSIRPWWLISKTRIRLNHSRCSKLSGRLRSPSAQHQHLLISANIDQLDLPAPEEEPPVVDPGEPNMMMDITVT